MAPDEASVANVSYNALIKGLTGTVGEGCDHPPSVINKAAAEFAVELYEVF